LSLPAVTTQWFGACRTEHDCPRRGAGGTSPMEAIANLIEVAENMVDAAALEF
jgi:hypothetical protein